MHAPELGAVSHLHIPILLRNSCTSQRALRGAQAPRWSYMPPLTFLGRVWITRPTNAFFCAPHKLCPQLGVSSDPSRAGSAPTVTPRHGRPWLGCGHTHAHASEPVLQPHPVLPCVCVCVHRQGVPICSVQPGEHACLPVCLSVCVCRHRDMPAAAPGTGLAGRGSAAFQVAWDGCGRRC